MSVEIIVGDCRETLKSIPDDSVQCCVTSPPYWGLRDYGHDQQLGSEATYGEYVMRMVEVFREIRRTLKPDGTLWLNLGDCYATGAGKVGNCPGGVEQGERWKGYKGARGGHEGKHGYLGGANGVGPMQQPNRLPQPGLKPKDLVGIPWRVAFALQADGWYLRSDIIWSKPNPMPESVTDRPTKAHEYLFLLSKSERYYYDAESILDPVSAGTHARLPQNVQEQIGSDRANGGKKTNGRMKAVGRKFDPAAGNKNNPSFDAAMAIMPETRNKRTVWTVPTQSYSGAHFATYPPQLIKPCILAGSRPDDTILDPFGGSGTTGMVSLELGRKSILCELNPEYAELARQRCNVTPGFPNLV